MSTQTVPSGPEPKSGNARGRVSRARLLEAAATCFGEHGYSATRVADITAEAGMSQGGFYRHFRDKDDILTEALQGPLDELLHATALDPDAAVDKPEIIARNTRFFAVYARYRRLFRVLREAATLNEPELTARWITVRSVYIERIENWLQTLQRGGRLEFDDIHLLAEALGAVLDQMAYTQLGLASSDPSDDEIRRLGVVSAELWYRTVAG